MAGRSVSHLSPTAFPNLSQPFGFSVGGKPGQVFVFPNASQLFGFFGGDSKSGGIYFSWGFESPLRHQLVHSASAALVIRSHSAFNALKVKSGLAFRPRALAAYEKSRPRARLPNGR